MRKIQFLLAPMMLAGPALCQAPPSAPASPDQLLLKNYRPLSIFKTPQTAVNKPKYPVIDIHTHSFGLEHLAERVKTMDEAGIEKQIVLLDFAGPGFDRAYAAYAKFPGRFEVWCNIHMEELKKPDFSTAAVVTELERCARAGAKGLGELSDKGEGLWLGRGGFGPHPDDPRLAALWEKCADLKMPVNLHMADPKWMYEPMDEHNDMLMLALKWRRDNKPGLVDHDGLMNILERVVSHHPRTIFIACHFANLEYDLDRLGRMLDKYPNLYTDSAARHQYLGTVPRYTANFMEKHQDRVLYGTDGAGVADYRETFRVWETTDEHFYWIKQQPLVMHWPLYGLGLKNEVLMKFYRDNALKILRP